MGGDKSGRHGMEMRLPSAMGSDGGQGDEINGTIALPFSFVIASLLMLCTN